MGNYCIKEEVKYTALHHAVICNNVDAATSLLWRGSSIYDKDSNGVTVIDLCNRIGSEEMKQMLSYYDTRNYNIPRIRIENRK
jgi:ankyrin repeat protein